MTESGSASVILGGAGGIGTACARRLGGHVILADLDPGRLCEAQERALPECESVTIVTCDVASRQSIDNLVDEVRATDKSLAALVNVSGVGPNLGGTRDLAPSDCRRMLDVNLIGATYLLEAFEPLLTNGSVGICVSSIGGHRRLPLQFDDLLRHPLAPQFPELLEARMCLDGNDVAVYAVSKRGINLQVELRAAAWGRAGARLVSVSPAHIEDTLMGSTIDPSQIQYTRVSALRRSGRAAEIANTIRFLASSDASYITGCDLLVDGGAKASIEHHVDQQERSSWHRANTRICG